MKEEIMIKQLDTTGHDFNIWQVDHDINGNARYVVHYLAIPYNDEDNKPFYINQNNHIEYARKTLNGRKYRAKWFGGGIVFQAYAGDPIKTVQARINAIVNGTDFITEFHKL